MKKENWAFRTREVYEFLENNQSNVPEIKKFCDEMVLKIQREIINYPIVYISKTTDIKTKKQYITGKTLFPISLTKRKHIRVYIGKANVFPNGIKDKSAMEIGRKKMKERLKKFGI
jgi:hypothetical protein